MPRIGAMYAGSSGFSHGQNKMYWGMGNGKWQGLPATRNMRTGPLLTHVRSQAYNPPEKRREVFLFNALAGGVGKMRSVRRCDYRCASSDSKPKPQLPNPSYLTRVDILATIGSAGDFGDFTNSDLNSNWTNAVLGGATPTTPGCPSSFALNPNAYITYKESSDIRSLLQNLSGYSNVQFDPTTLSSTDPNNVVYNYSGEKVIIYRGRDYIFRDIDTTNFYYQIIFENASSSLIQQVVSGLELIKVSDGKC